MGDKITAKRLRDALHYSPETGVFRWLAGSSRTRAGLVAGNVTRIGYRRIRIYGIRYQAHRLAWLYMTGDWPVEEVDHINLVKDDNRWSNLRAASRKENQRNRRAGRNNRSGVKGVSWSVRERKWRTSICVNSRHVHLGYFTNINDAADAREAASKKCYGEFSRP